MQQDILINWSPQETRVAIVEHGAVQELHLERTLERGLVGNVYMGKVVRVLPGMQSTFIDIGLDRAAFLHVADLLPSAAAVRGEGEPSQPRPGGNGQVPIERQVFEGQALMVQVVKDPIGTKGARLSTQISIAGRLLVFLPQDEHVGVSQKIPAAQREDLRRRLQALVGERVNGGTWRGDHSAGATARGDRAATPAPPPIERIVFEGQTLTVQVIKDPIGTKGARLSTQISIAGRLLVFLPQDDHIGISQKIGSHELREQLRTRMNTLAGKPPEGDPAPYNGGGFILRTNAEDATDEELADDIAYLRKTWGLIREKSFKTPPGELLHQDLSLVQRVLRDLASDNTQSIRIDSRMQYDQLVAFGTAFTPTSVSKLAHYKGERPIFDLYNIDDEVARALARRVDLKSGGYLIIDQTEALTTVDVNTGGYVGARNFDDTIFKTNLEATQAIARQLRLRNLGGIIIIDFIDMAREEHQNAVLSELRKQLARDRTKITVSGFTQLGLVEMTRKRTRDSLGHILCEPCPTCEGRGTVKTVETVCHEIAREVQRAARQFEAKGFLVLAATDVIQRLIGEESLGLAELEASLNRPIRLQAESTYGQESFDVVPL